MEELKDDNMNNIELFTCILTLLAMSALVKLYWQNGPSLVLKIIMTIIVSIPLTTYWVIGGSSLDFRIIITIIIATAPLTIWGFDIYLWFTFKRK